MKIEKNSFVTIDYLIRLGQGETFPPDGQPEEISFAMSGGVMPPGLEEALLGMVKDEHKVIHLTPDEAYGEIDQDLIMEVPRSDFGDQTDLRVGMVFETESEEGHPIHFIIKELKQDSVVIDFNHPLAGREMDVDFTVQGVREATPEDLESCTCSACAEKTSEHRH
ncbi:MAG: peptidylprolyl isomerase [Deltaproteobacteria bacterium]|nr:peptidylprolyl isomerase [Deltaproteobacteria bacterium]